MSNGLSLYLPPHISQRNPKDPLQFSHCWAAIGAWLANGATGGTVKLTAQEFAQRAGGGTGKITGSGTEQDIIHGLSVLGIDGQLIKVRFGDISDRVKTPRRALFAVATDYDVWPPELDCMNGTAGPDVNHMVGLVPGIVGGKVQAENPLCFDYQDAPMSMVERAAAKYSRAQGRDGVTLVRVVRPVPAALDDLRKELAVVTEERDQLRDYAAQMRQRASDMLDVTYPKGGS